MATLMHCDVVPLLAHSACVVTYKEATLARLSHSVAT